MCCQNLGQLRLLSPPAIVRGWALLSETFTLGALNQISLDQPWAMTGLPADNMLGLSLNRLLRRYLKQERLSTPGLYFGISNLYHLQNSLLSFSSRWWSKFSYCSTVSLSNFCCGFVAPFSILQPEDISSLQRKAEPLRRLPQVAERYITLVYRRL